MDSVCAGFSKGYAEELVRQKEDQGHFNLVDEEGNIVTQFPINKNDKVELLKHRMFTLMDEEGNIIAEVPIKDRAKVVDTYGGKKAGEKIDNRVKVRLKSTGETGTINPNEFDSAIYEKL